MDRESIAQLFYWPIISWTVCIIGVGSMLPQLLKIMRTHKVDDLSPTAFWIVFLSQLVYSIDGFVRCNSMLMICMGLGSLVSHAIIVLYYAWRCNPKLLPRRRKNEREGITVR